jgi:threonine/homoserine/homoserine lactone efflux protein
MPTAELALAVLLLLLTPGPTNTLILLAGAEHGLPGAVRLIPAELAGYLLAVVPLALAGQTVLRAWPDLRLAVALLAAAWVGLLALRLWRQPPATAAGLVSVRTVLVTTALNPKALIFGLVLLPAPGRLAETLALFAALVVLVALVWATAGSCLRDRAARPLRALGALRRLASVVLAAMSVALVVRGVTA